MRNPIPLRPDYSAAARTGPTSLERAGLAIAMAVAGRGRDGSAEVLGRERFGEDVAAIVKGASNPASSTGWGSELTKSGMGDFLSLLPSASGRLIAAGSTTTMQGVDTVSLPKRAATIDETGAAWTSEGQPSPVRQINMSAATLGPPKKLTVLIAATRELLEYTNADSIFASLMRENVSYALDYRMFSDSEGDDTAPAGLLAGISALTASASVDVGEAQRADLEALLASIAPASSGNAIIVCNPAQAFSIAVRLGRNFTIPVWPSAAVAPGRVIAIDPAVFASGFGDTPTMSASTQTALHMEDSDPAPLSTVADPNEVAAPIRSLFQTDCIALKLTMRCAWTLRAPAISWMENVGWGAVPA